MLEQSVIYQDILQKGEQRAKAHEQHVLLDLLEQTLGKVSSKARKQVARLNFDQMAALGKVLLKLKSEKELAAWLKQHTAS